MLKFNVENLTFIVYIKLDNIIEQKIKWSGVLGFWGFGGFGEQYVTERAPKNLRNCSKNPKTPKLILKRLRN
jgi:hypothetical protein